MKAGTAPIDRIKIEDRSRRDLGDLTDLATSIDERGLINPITVTSDLQLLTGQRRLEAVKSLGWREVDVRIADDTLTAAEALKLERDENTCRKATTASEDYALGKRIEALERPKAQERQGGTGRFGTAGSGSTEPEPQTARTTEVVGPAVGMSRTQWIRLKHIGDRAAEGDEVAVETLQQIDQGATSVSGGYTKLRQRDVTEAPDRSERTKLPAAERIEQVTDLAAQGYRASQIADRIGVSELYVRRFANEHGIELPDKALGKTRAIDPHRVVEQTVEAINNEAFALGMVALGDLRQIVTPEEANEWATSLSQSLKSLNHLRNQLKEIAQ